MESTVTALRLGSGANARNFAASLRTPDRGFHLYWLGQAGFCLTTPSGKRVVIDPYLTDYCERVIGGYHRIMAPVMTPEEFDCDLLLLSHAHEDHCDMDLLTALAQKGCRAKILATENCVSKLEALPLEVQKFSRGESFSWDDVTVQAIACDHGASAPDAVGYILECDGVRIYFAGDTCLNEAVVAEAASHKPDVALLPINGAYGNLSGVQAAQVAAKLQARVLIPCHFWTFVEHAAARPIELLEQAPTLCPETRLLWLAQGEGVALRGEE